MVSAGTSYEEATLKNLNYRLANLPVEKLCRIASHLAGQLAACRPIFQSNSERNHSGKDDVSVQVHRLKTRISTLLQDRTAEGRWAGIVLAKTALEVGNTDLLQSCGSWVRALLLVLNKPDPPATKKLCIVTITRILTLTWTSPALIREVTTPNLPSYVGSCLQLLQGKEDGSRSQLVELIIRSLSKLVPRHPNIFRTFAKRITAIVSPYFAPSLDLSPPSSLGESHVTPALQQAAQQLFVNLVETTPGKGAPDAWLAQVQDVIGLLHQSTNQIFRSVVEEWRSTAGHQSIPGFDEAIAAEPACAAKGLLDLGAWRGMQSGSNRVRGLLSLLRQILATKTSYAVRIPVGELSDLMRRLLLMARPSSLRNWEAAGRADPKFERKEREELALLLPQIHTSVVYLAHVLIHRCAGAATPVSADLQQSVAWVFQMEQDSGFLRQATYTLLTNTWHTHGPLLSAENLKSMRGLINRCCIDLVKDGASPKRGSATTSLANGNGASSATSNTNDTDGSEQVTREELRAAWSLLPVIFSSFPAQWMTKRMRADLDRAAIVTIHHEAMLASILNSSHETTSIIGMFAQSGARQRCVQAALKPMVPPTNLTSQISESIVSEEEDTYYPEPLPSSIESPNLKDEPRQSTTAFGRQFHHESGDYQTSAGPATAPMPPETAAKTALATERSDIGTERLPVNGVKRSAQADSESSDAKRQREDHIKEFAARPETIATLASERDKDVDREQPLAISLHATGHDQQASLQDSEDDDDFEIPPLSIGLDSEDEEA